MLDSKRITFFFLKRPNTFRAKKYQVWGLKSIEKAATLIDEGQRYLKKFFK